MSFRKLRAEWIVAHAPDLADAAARRAYFDRECGGNEALRREVEAILSGRTPAGKTQSGPPPLPPMGEQPPRIGETPDLPKPPPLPPVDEKPPLIDEPAQPPLPPPSSPQELGRARRHPVAVTLVALLLMLVALVVIRVASHGRSSRRASPVNRATTEAAANRGAATDAGSEFHPVSLEPWCNAPLGKGWVPPLTRDRVEGNGLLGLEPGRQVLSDVEFNLRGIIQLSSIPMRDERSAGFPEQVAGIRVGQKCQRLHFLHACAWNERDGTEVGRYVVHFADGEQLDVPIIYGVDLRDWQMWSTTGVGGPADDAVAWAGTNATAPMRLYRSVWDNPKDNVTVERIDFVSAMTRSAPFLVGLTAQELSPLAPEFWISRARILERQGQDADADPASIPDKDLLTLAYVAKKDVDPTEHPQLLNFKQRVEALKMEGTDVRYHEGFAAARYERDTGRILTRSTDPAWDFNDGGLKLDMKGPITIESSTGHFLDDAIVESNIGNFAQAIADKVAFTPANYIVVDTFGMSFAQEQRLLTELANRGVTDLSKIKFQ